MNVNSVAKEKSKALKILKVLTALTVLKLRISLIRKSNLTINLIT